MRNKMEPQHTDKAALASTGTGEQSRQGEQVGAKRMRTSWLKLRIVALYLFVISTVAPFSAQEAPPAGVAARPVAVAKPSWNSPADAAALVTEFDVNGLKVLVKRREGNQTVVAGLFIKGGSRNITAANAGIEDLMLDSASEASVNLPRERLRTEMSRMGTAISSGVDYDYSVL